MGGGTNIHIAMFHMGYMDMVYNKVVRLETNGATVNSSLMTTV